MLFLKYLRFERLLLLKIVILLAEWSKARSTRSVNRTQSILQLWCLYDLKALLFLLLIFSICPSFDIDLFLQYLIGLQSGILTILTDQLTKLQFTAVRLSWPRPSILRMWVVILHLFSFIQGLFGHTEAVFLRNVYLRYHLMNRTYVEWRILSTLVKLKRRSHLFLRGWKPSTRIR